METSRKGSYTLDLRFSQPVFRNVGVALAFAGTGLQEGLVLGVWATSMEMLEQQLTSEVEYWRNVMRRKSLIKLVTAQTDASKHQQ